MTENQTIEKTENNYPNFLDLSNLPSMDDLLGESDDKFLGEGSIVSGKIVDKRDSGLIIDIGYKAEGFIPKDEFLDWKSANIGDEIQAILETMEDDTHCMPILSVQKAVMQQAWDGFIQKHKEGEIIKGLVKNRVKGGFIIDVGLDAFLPGSQVDIVPVKNMDDLIGKEYDLKILKINTERRNIVVSRREILEEEKSRQRAVIMLEILPGQIRKGVVKNITDFGAFIDMNGIDGLLHITDMSWGRISHPSEMLELYQEVEAVILDVDREKERVSLGLKQKKTDPWDSVEERYPVKTKIKGKVVNVMPYGGFIQLEEGVEGLIHISEMSWTKRITRASEVLEVGQEIEAVILEIQRETKKISLGLRQTMENPWDLAAKKYPTGTQIKGKVRNITSYGAFIEIEEDIDGMVHVSDMSWTRKINNPAEVLTKGDDVEAIVLDIDPQQKRISLGVKQLEEDPWEKIDEIFRVGDSVKGTVRKLANFGAFIQLNHDIDGLIHISQISNDRIDKINDVFKIGDEVETQIIKIDASERRIGLSQKSIDEPVPVKSEKKGDSPKIKTGNDNMKPGAQMVDVGNIFDNAIEASEQQQQEKPESESNEKSGVDEN